MELLQAWRVGGVKSLHLDVGEQQAWRIRGWREGGMRIKAVDVWTKGGAEGRWCAGWQRHALVPSRHPDGVAIDPFLL